LPLIRPFPQEFSDRLDDKVKLNEYFLAAGCGDLQPPTWCAVNFPSAKHPLPCENHACSHDFWFLKHRFGVKGKGVHVFAGTDALRKRLEELGDRSCRNFVVQQGIAPPALLDGRKWMMRVHVLLHGNRHGELQAYCHNDIIVIRYGQPYTERPEVRAAHISSAGLPKHWPKPTLLDDMALAERIRALAASALLAVWQHAPRGPYHPHDAELCQVFGLDIMVDAFGRPWILEVNSYPAIASGTMDHVEPYVYSNLVRDVLRLVVLPRVNGSDLDQGGFVRLHVEPVSLDIDAAPVAAAAAADSADAELDAPAGL